jgi:hypothetical protein
MKIAFAGRWFFRDLDEAVPATLFARVQSPPPAAVAAGCIL